MSTGWEDDDTALFVRYGDAFVPRRKEQFDVVCDLLAEMPRPDVLELGCGDGRLTEHILGRLSEVRVTAVDASAGMLRLARDRLAVFPGRVTLRHAGMEDRGAMADGPYGAVVTSLAVHHLDDRAKQALYRLVRASLAPGGSFVMADLVLPVGRGPLAVAADRWDAEVRATEPEATAPFEAARWNTFRFPDPVDRPSRVGDHLDWLAGAGFSDVDVCWVYAGHAVLHARRSEPSEETT
ncbi:trans-aconitate 2-methyltransferase [Streptomyces sp. LUP30]|uniref:class I SAM-dependent methyltransferase n=1 Tax=Streptomyces sp. LUP30 TaxID=1890285 RepID=UPI0008520052|nr:class I SAM-dependent methyltransferase [Streptomyces sp. LUP30]